jgi:hypothetical protein
MKTILRKSTENMIVLFLLSVVSALVVDYQAHGFPPAPGVIYSSILFAFFAFLTTMGTQRYKDRKQAKKNPGTTTQSESSSAEHSPSEIAPQEQPDPPSGDLKASGPSKDKPEDWLIGLVI